MTKKATLEVNGQKYEFPLSTGTENEVAINITYFFIAKPDLFISNPFFRSKLYSLYVHLFFVFLP